MLLGVDLDMGMQDLIRSDAHHTLAVLNFVPKSSFFFYVFQLQHRIGGLVTLQQLIGERAHLSPANKKKGQRNAAPLIEAKLPGYASGEAAHNVC
jgi:hypothetical protein